MVAAAIAPNAVTSGVGIDIEIRTLLTPDLQDAILTNFSERNLAGEDPDGGLWIFCAKEATYKAIYPLIRRVIGFDILAITCGDEKNSFDAILQADVGIVKRGFAVHGFWKATDIWVAAAATLPHNHL